MNGVVIMPVPVQPLDAEMRTFALSLLGLWAACIAVVIIGFWLWCKCQDRQLEREQRNRKRRERRQKRRDGR